MNKALKRAVSTQQGIRTGSEIGSNLFTQTLRENRPPKIGTFSRV